jgi:hypothetical protein
MIGVSGKHIGNNLAESSREEAFIHISDGLMYIFLAGGDSALKVPGRVTHLA